MKKNTIIVAICLVVVGVLVCSGVLITSGFDFDKLSTEQYESKTYNLDEKFTDINIETNMADVEFVLSDSNECKVVCDETDKIKHSVDVEDNTLVIDVDDNRRWFDYIGISFGSLKVTIYLPETEFNLVEIETATGYVTVPKDFSFVEANIETDTGDITWNAPVEKALSMTTDTGYIYADDVLATELKLNTDTGDIIVNSGKIAESIEVKVDTARVELTNVECNSLDAKSSTGEVVLSDTLVKGHMKVKTSTGDVVIDSSDAQSLDIETATGDVTGSLLSEKVFVTDTETGDIDVPKSTTGGTCQIITDTGSIEIEIK